MWFEGEKDVGKLKEDNKADVVVNSSTSPVRRSLDELLGARRPLPLAPPPSSDSDPLSDAPPRGTTSVSGVSTFIELKIFKKKLRGC